MARYNLGRILPVFRGVWESNVAYQRLDVVFWKNCSWMAVSDNDHSEPTDTNTDNWMCIARGSSFQDWSDNEKNELVRLINISLEQPIQQSINNYINNTLDTDTVIQQWMRLISMSQAEYDALSDKSGIHFVYL